MLVEMALASYPGHHQMAPPGKGGSYGEYWPGLIAQAELAHRVVHADGSSEIVAPPPVTETPPVAGTPEPEAYAGGATRTLPLGRVAYARSGDKGGDGNVGIWAPGPAAWPWLRAALTVEALRKLLPEAAGLEISRYELPNLRAVNFVIHGLLGEGATSTTRFDKQAKALAERVRARHLPVPENLTA
jgi:hypothetical protein